MPSFRAVRSIPLSVPYEKSLTQTGSRRYNPDISPLNRFASVDDMEVIRTEYRY
jgi:hypothetical protein